MRYAAIIGLVAALILFFVAITIVSDVAPPPPAPIVVQPDSLLTTVVKPHFYGFIPGGVQAVGQFKRALSADPALAAQFPGFDWSKAHFETLKQPECAYIAYRRGDEFAWARKCRMIYAGELILTDGQFRIRAVCGNLISNTPMAPTIPMDTEPVAIALPDTPPTGTATTTPALADGPSVPPSLMPVTPVTPVGGPLLGTPSPIGLCCGVVTGPIVTVPDGDGGPWEALLVSCVITGTILWRKK